MAHFHGKVQGNRKPVTRCSTKHHGITARANGWHLGGSVIMYHLDGWDHVKLYVTGGTNATWTAMCIAHYREKDGIIEQVED